MINLRRSIFITLLSTNGSTAIQFAVTLVLARLLTPAEVGIFSITVVLINIIGVFRDFGVSSYLLQEKTLTPEKASSALGLLITSASFFALLTFLSRHLIADYYGQPGIANVIGVLCISFVIVPFSAFYHTILGRDIQAGKQAIVNIVSTVAYAITCLTLAYLGFSYMALAWANVANIAVSIAVYFAIRPSGFPCRPKFSGWLHPLKYGSGAVGGNLITNINRSIPDLVLGKIGGAHDVGLYSRANGLIGIFQQVAGPTISYTALPYIARNHHSNVVLGPILAKATSYLTGIAWPAFIVTAAFSEEIISLLYGKQWLAAAPIAKIICIQILVGFGYSLTEPALMAIGRPYLSAVMAGASVITKLTIVFGFGTASIMEFAIAICVADILTIAVPAFLMSRFLRYSITDSIKAHWPSIKLGIACLIVVGLIKLWIPTAWPDYLQLGFVAIIMLPAWIAGLLVFRHPLREELPIVAEKLFPPETAYRIRDFITGFDK